MFNVQSDKFNVTCDPLSCFITHVRYLIITQGIEYLLKVIPSFFVNESFKCRRAE